MKDNQLVIWGCGGMGREVNHLCELLGYEVVGFLDERLDMRGQIVDDIPVLGDLPDIMHLRDQLKVVCAGVGSPQLKKRLVQKTRDYGFSLAETIVHPAVQLSRKIHLGIGSILCAGTILTINVHIGHFVIVNSGVTLAHDVKICDYATISPGVHISGNVTVEEGAFIGTGSALREKITIGPWSMIGGGAFVKDDVPGGVLYAGVPAVFKKKLI
ncbi:acetyltransferase [Paenibacillus radicis (ex Xue et al. 2023)]|uniref:Acetyltransferase n=1 Tax=Paenibacillus radicis (ex Xue et al. 2023) TaxID=2972489 RepID=A0ABT1YSX9_9BACL|nr:acetyltransferase [Paenibacillus radicis (ex Xue et al. 2023)]MCR8635085.1 acetyltransferase [Paenibacillus radicis (ex Xue et al. 2023)]